MYSSNEEDITYSKKQALWKKIKELFVYVLVIVDRLYLIERTGEDNLCMEMFLINICLQHD